ncbi:hypothetical protein [Chryseobacterium jejuense]|uniref:Lipoprotein n=1 Tax=Chryseobacterium jejuense TaxID=445960 RepID=A0A2X2WZC3_CHRJE|nr:hypothetical protein [Chryseobacterium jejuense]SDJ81197.1 hypothetical protein SAMN05421542_4452 [Chryseobacterium jejuense]SQB43611.1 Uncharacterised protein [Chryseobacterium jejuense]
MTTKAILTSLFIISLLSSCKKKTLEQKIESLPPAQTTAIATPSKETIANMENNSFTLSCGAGCAATYTAEEISQDKTSVKVKFKVENYINDKLEETNEETYLFYYSNTGEIDKIINQETNKNILDEYILDAQESFKEFAASLIKNKKVEIPQVNEQGNSANTKYRISALPFDHEDYYSTCYVKFDEKECANRYPKYSYPENKNILEEYGIKDIPTSFFMLPKINNVQPFILAYTDSDIEGYDLIVAAKNKVISSLQIAEFDGETVNDFIITKNFEIELYTRKNTTEKRILKKKYRIQPDGKIK